MDKLKPCPFCGNNVYIYIKERKIGNSPYFSYPFVSEYEIRCRSCGLHFPAGFISFDYADGQFFKDEKYLNKRIQQWNKRAEEKEDG